VRHALRESGSKPERESAGRYRENIVSDLQQFPASFQWHQKDM